jgi:hypothetical protein
MSNDSVDWCNYFTPKLPTKYSAFVPSKAMCLRGTFVFKLYSNAANDSHIEMYLHTYSLIYAVIDDLTNIYDFK